MFLCSSVTYLTTMMKALEKKKFLVDDSKGIINPQERRIGVSIIQRFAFNQKKRRCR